MTEKLFEAYLAGAIPIYYGDRTGLKDINPKAIIYAGDFASEADLIAYIQRVDTDDRLYASIWKEPLFVYPQVSYKAIQGMVSAKLKPLLENRFGRRRKGLKILWWRIRLRGSSAS